jgi:hypothetical protein
MVISSLIRDKIRMDSQPQIHEARFGPLQVQIDVGDPVAALVSAELGGERVAQRNPEADLQIKLLKRASEIPDYAPQVFSAKGRMHFNSEAFFVGYDRYFECLIRGAFEHSRPLELFLIPRRGLAKLRKTDAGRKSTIMTYGFFWMVAHLALLKRGATFLHAGIYADGQRAIALTGTGGCGKTSCLFRQLEVHPTYQYLSEDFGIITRTGETHYNPKFISIYKSDTRQRILREYVLRRLPAAQKPYFYGLSLLRGNPRVKVAPSDVLGPNRTGNTARLGRVAYLLRGDFDKLEAVPIDANELAERCLSVTLREMKNMMEILHLMNANRISGMGFPSPSEWEQDQRSLYRGIFAEVDATLLRVPARCGPSEICALVDGLEGPHR